MPLRGFPLGGSSLQSKVMRGDRTTFRHFFQKAALYSTLIPGFPFGEAVGFRRLKRSLQAFPFPPRPPLPKHSRPYSFFVVISRLSSFRLFRPLQSPFFILPALFKNHFSSQSSRSESLFSPEAQLLSHNFPQNAFYRATFFYFKCEHLFVFL